MSTSVFSDTPKVQSLDEVLKWLDRLEKSASARSTSAWTLNGVMEHLAQSIEMSMDGFPQPKSAIFQATAGSAAFAFFKFRGAMSHGLTEPIPGAPVLQQQDVWKPGADRLRLAVGRFQKHTGALMPHFAYGALSHADFALAHTFHIANHQDAIALG